jgi:hypothetical protein
MSIEFPGTTQGNSPLFAFFGCSTENEGFALNILAILEMLWTNQRVSANLR